MTANHLRVLWTAFGLVLAFFVLNAWLSSTGANPIFKAELLDNRRIPGAVLAIPIVSVLLILVSEIARRHALLSQGSAWHSRLPVIGFSDLDTSTSEGKLYQGFFLLIFILIPIASLVHFSRIVLSGTVISRVEGVTQVLAPLSWPETPGFGNARFWNDGYRIGEGLVPGQSGGVTWFPIVEPTILVILMIASVFCVVRTWRALVR